MEHHINHQDNEDNGRTDILDRILCELGEIKLGQQTLMSAIQDWAAKEQADLTAISSTLDTIVTGIANLDTLITAAQGSGTLSADDQAALDAIKTASDALLTKAQAISVAPPAAPAPATT